MAVGKPFCAGTDAINAWEVVTISWLIGWWVLYSSSSMVIVNQTYDFIQSSMTILQQNESEANSFGESSVVLQSELGVYF